MGKESSWPFRLGKAAGTTLLRTCCVLTKEFATHFAQTFAWNF